MAKFQARFFPRDKNTYFITVTSYEDKHLCGYFHRVCTQETIPFSGLIQLTLLLEDDMDEENRPQRDMETRRFCPTRRSPWRACLRPAPSGGPFRP